MLAGIYKQRGKICKVNVQDAKAGYLVNELKNMYLIKLLLEVLKCINTSEPNGRLTLVFESKAFTGS